MGMPSKLKNMNVFMDGVSWIGEVTEFTPAKLARKMEGYRAGGMNGEVAIDQGMDGMVEIEFTAGGWMRQSTQAYGAAQHDAVQLRFAGAYQRDDDGSVDAVEIVAHGRFKEIDRGNAKPGADTETKHKMVCSFYSETVNGVPDVIIDLPNMIEIIGGIDRLAEQRAAIGA